jgi:small neutral amino acid transporter SnatA (MarC family)
VVGRALATIVLAAACWAVWWYSPMLLKLLGLDDLDIPGRVCAVFLFLTLVEAVIARLQRM